ncbi:MAG: hypothetical protein GXO54_03180 [Chloroflexi bacterium]|nr:hypothetical protein [Chloroflexota bacterium]
MSYARVSLRAFVLLGLGLLLLGCQALMGGGEAAMPTLLPTPTPAPNLTQPAMHPTSLPSTPAPTEAPSSGDANTALPTPSQDSGAEADVAWWWFPAEGVSSLRFRYQIIVQSPRHQNGEPWTYAVVEGEAQREPPIGHWTLYEKGTKILELYATPQEAYLWQEGQGWIYAQSSDATMMNTMVLLGPALDMSYAMSAPTVGQDQGATEINGIRARHYTWSVDHVDQLQAYDLVPYEYEILESLGYPPDAQPRVVAFQADLYLAEDGGWPVKQTLTWDLQVEVNGQTEPLRVQALYEVYDFNADLNLQIPAEAQSQAQSSPIPMPPGAQNVTSIVGPGGSGWIYQTDLTLEALLAFWQENGVQIQEQLGSLNMGSVMLQVVYQDQPYTIAIQPADQGLTVIITPSE